MLKSTLDKAYAKILNPTLEPPLRTTFTVPFHIPTRARPFSTSRSTIHSLPAPQPPSFVALIPPRQYLSECIRIFEKVRYIYQIILEDKTLLKPLGKYILMCSPSARV